MLVSPNPSALSTPSSGSRSATDCDIVFPARNSSVNNTAPMIQLTNICTSPTWRMLDANHARSFIVVVSLLEFANSRSIAIAIASGSAPVASDTTN